MVEFLFAAAGLLLVSTIVGLIPMLTAPTDSDRMLTAQLAGSGGVAMLVLFAVAAEAAPVLDVALLLALLAAFASVAFLSGVTPSPDVDDGP